MKLDIDEAIRALKKANRAMEEALRVIALSYKYRADDFIVQMPPVREYTLRVRIKSIEKATPHIVGPEA